MGYSREEQETVLRYDSIERKWIAYSAYPPHIRRIRQLAEIIGDEEVDENGNTVSIRATMGEKCVKISRPKQISEEHKAKLIENAKHIRRKNT